MKSFVKKRFPKVMKLLNRLYNYVYHLQFYNKTAEDVFSTIYIKNQWADQESFSGPGSSIEKTSTIRELIPDLILKYGIATVLDIPCGDFNWMKKVDLGNVNYIGLDIVKELVNKNIGAYSTSHRSFAFADITDCGLPKADLIICRDCLVHLSNDDIYNAVANMKRSQSTFLLTTTFPQHANYNIITGNWRPVNLCAKPFQWTLPLELFSENEVGDNRDKSLGLWRIDKLE